MRARTALAAGLLLLAPLLPGLVPAFPAAAAAVPGLVAAYGFEEGSGSTALDASGTGSSGTVSGATWTASGRHGGALSFDGVDDRVDVPHSAALALTTGMTVEAWVRPSSTAGWRTVAMKARSNGLSYALYASGSSPRPSAYLNSGGGDVGTVGPTSLPPGSWVHLTSTYDGATARLFVDGVQVAQRAQSGPLASSPGSLSIGGNVVWGEWFAGLLDEVRIYSRALTAAEIMADMATPVGTGAAPPPPPGGATRGAWAGPVELGIVAVNMVQLHTGKVLMYRGEGAGGSSATVWDPLTGVRTPVPAPYNLFCSGHAQLPDGRILVVGGHDSLSGVLGSAEAAVFDPVSGTWTSVPPMSQRRWYPSATTLPDGRVIVTSGAKTGFTDIADVPELYDPAANAWTRLDAARSSFPYYPFSFVLPDGRLLIAGAGEHPGPTQALDVAAQRWTTLDPATVDGGSAAMYRPGRVLKSGTSATTDVDDLAAAATTYVLDATGLSTTWRQAAPMAHPRAYHTLTPLPDGTVVVTGGGRRTEGKRTADAVYEAEIWSPETETWRTMAPMSVPRQYHGTALLLPDARVLVAGSGDSYGGPRQTTAEFFSPPYLYAGPRPALIDPPAVAAHGSSFTATTDRPVKSVALVRPGAVTHQFDEDARYVDLAFQQDGGRLTVTAPATSALAPPGFYMLFVVAEDGTPSTASFVRLPVPGAVPPPPAPTGLHATAGQGGIALSWSGPNGGTPVAGYTVHRSTTAGFLPSAATEHTRTTRTEHIDTTAVAGTTYSYRVMARDAAGDVSAASEAATATAVDGAPPVVRVTAPTSGANVSGTSSVAATASDDVGVVGVQVRVDGVPLGAEDTAAPYETNWDTRTVPDGGHVLDAVARDAAGARTTSMPVSVIVANAAPPPPPPASSGLVGAWSFDEGSGVTAMDRSGQGNHGRLAGAAWSSAGHSAGALSLDGVDDRVDVPDSSSLDLTTGMTIEAWVRPSTTGGWRTLVLKERGTSGLSYGAYTSNAASRPTGLVRLGSDRSSSAPAALALDTWTHLAVTYDGAALRVLVNGAQASSTPMTGPIATSAGLLRIGGNGAWGEWFSGAVDDVRIYDRALTVAEVARDMRAPVN